uniref:Type III effector HopPmaJ n=1 Tax=uncultured Thiotrichaceae bacterium TaxID=298394 RepID=A0A6S6S0H3_9GAMM|nr:MAG: Type III effector HopPmaJ [uncultured Thiotrichaceae bacterium]
MTPQTLIEQLNNNSESLVFSDVIAAIDANYEYTPQTFKNGEVENAAGTNEGSCKVFAFAQLNDLSQEQTLTCFAEHYRSVLATPEGNDHGNIRNFMETGWDGINFTGVALQAK